MADRTNQPMPPGWEAKWDPGQQRYFFIDHSTKKTSWEDPRLSQPSPSNAFMHHQQQSGAQHSAAAKAEHIPMRNLSSTGTAKPKWQEAESMFSTQDEKNKLARLQKMFPTAPSWKITNILQRHENNMDGVVAELERSGYQQQDLQSQRVEEAIVTKLNKEFASAEVGVVRDIVQCFDNNEERARSELKALGYASVSEKPAASSSSSRSSPHKKSASPARASSPAKEPSDAEKNKMKAKLAAEFPDYSASMLDIALGSCQYKLDRARTIISNMQNQRKKSETSTARARTRSPSPASPLSASSSSTARSRTPDFNVTFPDIGTSFNFPSLTNTASSSKKATKTGQKQKRQPQGESAASRLAKSPKKGPAAKQTTRKFVHKTVTTPSTYVSENRTPTMGANPELAKGADRDLLIDDYQPFVGPNHEICHGPDEDNVAGPSGNFGPDPSLRQGPDHETHEGANDELWKGSSLATTATQRFYQSEI